MIATKLYVPTRRRGLVARPRLIERLGPERRETDTGVGPGRVRQDDAADGVAAPRRPIDRSVAWLSLDPADNEPATFWTYVVTALRQAVPGVGTPALALPRPPPCRSNCLLTALLNELAAAPAMSGWCSTTTTSSTARDRRRDGLPAGAPPASRARGDHAPAPTRPAAVPVAGRGELVEIRAADLRFTPDEAAAYLNEVAGLELAAERRRRPGGADRGVDRRAAARRALHSGDATDVGGFIARFAGNDRYIVDYLVEEVLEHQPEPVREFLLQTAVLDRLTGPLCDAVTGRDDGGQMLIDPGARQPVPRPPGRSAGVVPLPPPVRRRAAGAPAQRAAGAGSAAAPARQPVVRAPRSGRGRGQARAGRRRLRPRGAPDGAGRADDPAPPAGSDAVTAG